MIFFPNMFSQSFVVNYFSITHDDFFFFPNVFSQSFVIFFLIMLNILEKKSLVIFSIIVYYHHYLLLLLAFWSLNFLLVFISILYLLSLSFGSINLTKLNYVSNFCVILLASPTPFIKK